MLVATATTQTAIPIPIARLVCFSFVYALPDCLAFAVKVVFPAERETMKMETWSGSIRSHLVV